MAIIPTNVRNYFKLELLLAHSQVTFRQLFTNRYSLFYSGNTWNDTQTCGSNYLTSLIARNKKINLTSLQKTSISNGNSNEWDLSTVITLLLYDIRPTTLDQQQIQQLDREDQLLKQLREIRNKIIHHPSKSIDDVELDQLWADLTSILVAFGDVAIELDKLKDDSVFDPCVQSINEENVKEALHLNSLGTQAHKDGRYSDAISFFTKATGFVGVSDHDRAVFYSNMSSSRLALYEQQPNSSKLFEVDDPRDERYRALQDAKEARNLWPTWWKGHFCVGKAYATMNEHERAIRSFERAFALAPTNTEIRKALDDSRDIYARQSRQEHLDPRMKPTTMVELLNELQQKLGIDPQEARRSHSLLENFDPVGADVVRGHKYEHGDSNVEQDYEQAAKYFAKAASQGNAEGLYNLARLMDRGLGVKQDHNLALRLFEQAAEQPPQHPKIPDFRNPGVAEAEHALGLKYADGIGVYRHLPTAAYWYQRAIDHDLHGSANNLGLMYQDGLGVERNLGKAEQLFEMAARSGDPNAMLSLAKLLLIKNDLRMAKLWHDWACEAGNGLAQAERHIFERALQIVQELINYCPPDVLQSIKAKINVFTSLKFHNTMYQQLDKPRMYDYNILSEHASRGSVTAKRMCNAFEHFFEVIYILIDSETLTETEENTFVHELSQCYRIEHIVAQFPGLKAREKVDKIIDRVLHRCTKQLNDATSKLDEDVRICYAVLHMDSHELIVEFLNQCKQKYPKTTYFFELSAAVNGFLKRYETTLYNANSGLEIDPNYIELYYDKAVALRLIGKDMDETIQAYQAFLAIAPKDHRKVPESYYAIASCYLPRYNQEGTLDIIKKTYEQGEEVEKIQLPCFLPYDSNNKTVIKLVIDPKFQLNTESTPTIDRELRLTKPHRIDVITKHRKWEHRVIKTKNYSYLKLWPSSHKPPLKQRTAKSLTGLKPISIREMNPTKDHVYDGFVLSVKIIDEVYSWSPSIHLVVEDDDLECERMCVYGFPEEQGQYLTREVYTIGSKMHIINPYLRIGANDMKPLIRIDDCSSIIMQDESERVVNMCRCCGESNVLFRCSKCKQAHYCNKECQTMDWQIYKHRLICKKQ